MFMTTKLPLAGKGQFEMQSLYCSIGWSLPASMGYALAAPGRRVVCVIGDGALQMTIQARGGAHGGRGRPAPRTAAPGWHGGGA